MKGSPILSTITATLLMAGAYLWLNLSLTSEVVAEDNIPNTKGSVIRSTGGALSPEDTISCYIEAHFSSPPTKFTISDAVSGRAIATVSNLSDNEWSDEITLLKGESIELMVQATWQNDSNNSNKQNFIQLILSPDQMADSEVTLRNTGEIDTTAFFTLSP